MPLEQALIAGLLLALLVVFALDRYRIEVVALVGLACGLLLGLVPMERAFSGLSSPAVITVIEILLIIQALDRSYLMDRLGAWLRPRLDSPQRVILGLCATGAGLSTVMNNIGAYALMLPVAFSLSQSAGLSPRSVLMPLSFATLLGGLCSVVGTPANLIVSEALREARGTGFSFLDFVPTGLAVTGIGLAVMAIWAPRALSVPQEPVGSQEDAFGRRIVTEVTMPGSATTRSTVADLSARIGGGVHAVIREGRRLFPLVGETELRGGDLLLIDAEGVAFRTAIAAGEFAAARSRGPGSGSRMDAAIMPQSILVGSRVAAIEDFSARDIRVVAVTTHNSRIEGGLDVLRLGIGDTLHLEGEDTALRDAVEETGLMQLAPSPRLEGRAFSSLPITVFVLGILAAAFGVAPPEIAFGAVALALAVAGALDLNAALADLNWPIILLLVAMLPLGEAVATTGVAATIAAGVTAAVPVSSTPVTCALVLGLAMLVTPFVNNATTAVIFAPIALEIAQETATSPALMLMAISIGASCDFLTPFGHHNNTLAYGLGGYRFRDFLRMGWPVSIATFAVGVLSCVLVWS